MIGGVIISLVFEWRIGLISTILLPLILIAGASRSLIPRHSHGFKDSDYKSEAVIYIRTVHAIRA